MNPKMWTATVVAALPAVLIGCSGGANEPPPGGDPCETAGNICSWLGKHGIQQFTGEGTAREDTILNLPVDIEFAEDGTGYFPDYNNHRVREIATDGTVNTVSGTGMLGDGPNT